MMQRKLLSLVLAFAMTAGLLTVGAGAAGPAYGDTVGHWAEGSIGRWIEHGIVQGSNGAFAPNAPIARERAMVILGRAMGIEPIENPDLTKSGGLQQSVVAACFRGVIEFYSLWIPEIPVSWKGLRYGYPKNVQVGYFHILLQNTRNGD